MFDWLRNFIWGPVHMKHRDGHALCDARPLPRMTKNEDNVTCRRCKMRLKVMWARGEL